MNEELTRGSRITRWTRRQMGFAGGGALMAWLGLGSVPAALAKRQQHKRQGRAQHEQANLIAVGGSGISGFVTLQQPPSQSGPNIVVHATGLTPGTAYVSLYYSKDNHVCQLEDYDAEDVIGGSSYVGNPAGNGQTVGRAADDITEIGSVSVRLANSDLTLMACAAL